MFASKDPLTITHLISVWLFLLIYLVKTFLLLANKKEGLAKFTKTVKVPEMIISAAFLVTGAWMISKTPMNTLHYIKIALVLLSIPVAIVGFKKANKALAALSFLMLIGSYGLAEVAKKKRIKGTDVTPTEMTADAGKEIYTAKCSSCHGDDGKAGTSGATDLSVSTISRDSVESVITNGRGAMMRSFKEELTPEQIKKVAEYTEGLRGK